MSFLALQKIKENFNLFSLLAFLAVVFVFFLVVRIFEKEARYVHVEGWFVHYYSEFDQIPEKIRVSQRDLLKLKQNV